MARRVLSEAARARLVEGLASRFINQGRKTLDLYRTTGRDMSRLKVLRRGFDHQAARVARAKAMPPLERNRMYANAKLATKRLKSAYQRIWQRHAKRVGIPFAAGTAAISGTKTYHEVSKALRQKPQFRRYDVYPQHEFSAQGATKYQYPYGVHSYGREEPRRSGPPTLEELLSKAKQFVEETPG